MYQYFVLIIDFKSKTHSLYIVLDKRAKRALISTNAKQYPRY